MGAPLAQGAAGAIREKMDREVGVTVMSWCRDRGAQDGRLVSAEVNGGRGANAKQAQIRPDGTGGEVAVVQGWGFPS